MLSVVQKRVLTEISSDIFFSKSSSSVLSKASASLKSASRDKDVHRTDSDSDCDDMHGICLLTVITCVMLCFIMPLLSSYLLITIFCEFHKLILIQYC